MMFDEEPAEYATAGQAALHEIWVSFASLLRAYMAASELHRQPPHAVVNGKLSRIIIMRGSRQFAMDHVQGLWSMSDEAGVLAHGAFTLDEQSHIGWPGYASSLELDAAAEVITELFLDTERHMDAQTPIRQGESRKQA